MDNDLTFTTCVNRAYHAGGNFTVKALLLILCICTLAGSVSGQDDVTGLIEKAVLLYHEGKFEEAELTGLRALTNAGQLAEVDRARLHRILGFTYVVLGEREKAKRQFVSWLELDPFASLDPIYISPKIISVFEEAKREYEQLQKQRTPPDYTELELQLNALERSIIFPGLGQIYRGQQTKGFGLLLAETALLGTIAYCQVNYIRTRDDYMAETDPQFMQDLYDEYNLYYRARNATIVLAVGVYVYSLLDVIYFPPGEAGREQSLSIQLNPDPARFLTLSIGLP